MERGKQLPSKFEADPSWWPAVGMKGHDAIIVEVEDPDPIAATNGCPVDEMERSMTASDLDPGRQPHLRPGRVEAVKEPVHSVVGGNQPSVRRRRGPHQSAYKE